MCYQLHGLFVVDNGIALPLGERTNRVFIPFNQGVQVVRLLSHPGTRRTVVSNLQSLHADKRAELFACPTPYKFLRAQELGEGLAHPPYIVFLNHTSFCKVLLL